MGVQVDDTPWPWCLRIFRLVCVLFMKACWLGLNATCHDYVRCLMSATFMVPSGNIDILVLQFLMWFQYTEYALCSFYKFVCHRDKRSSLLLSSPFYLFCAVSRLILSPWKPPNRNSIHFAVHQKRKIYTNKKI